MTFPLTQADFDEMDCEAPDCPHDCAQGLSFRQACHPEAGFRLVYLEGILRLHCCRCESLALLIAVARRIEDVMGEEHSYE